MESGSAEVRFFCVADLPSVPHNLRLGFGIGYELVSDVIKDQRPVAWTSWAITGTWFPLAEASSIIARR
ncbi:hypothetical protein SAMN05442782_10869 [Streptomyces sp. OK228]|nr:hypothetical protein SAMN05442782_10869 [Streptomyces sp. OK228]